MELPLPRKAIVADVSLVHIRVEVQSVADTNPLMLFSGDGDMGDSAA